MFDSGQVLKLWTCEFAIFGCLLDVDSVQQSSL